NAAPIGKDASPTGSEAVKSAVAPAVPSIKNLAPADTESSPSSAEPAPAGKESAPAQGNLPEKPPIPPPLSSGNQLDPISTAPGATIPSSYYGEVPATVSGGDRLALEETVPAAFFTHSPVPQ